MKTLFLIPIILVACSKSNSLVPVPKVGDKYQGGIVFYVLQSGDPNYIPGETHGFIAAQHDLTGLYIWGCQNAPTGQFGYNLGDGSNNTQVIKNACSGVNAGSACNGLVLNGYSDWFLPSGMEISAMFHNKVLVGGLTSGNYYWSSSKAGYTDAYAMSSSDVAPNYFPIISSYNVRPIRKF